jgi:hypothetical protein
MNRTAQILRLLMGSVLLSMVLFVAGCAGEKDKVTFEQFSELVRTDRVAEVTVYKPTEGKEENHIVGRYRRPAPPGTTALDFETDGKVDDTMIAQLKASGVSINFKD